MIFVTESKNVSEGIIMGDNYNGQKLKEIRLLFQLTYTDVADLLNASMHDVIDFELSRKVPSFNEISLLCKRFDVKPKYFFSKSLLSKGIDPLQISIRQYKE